jgi:hypothetical protein
VHLMQRFVMRPVCDGRSSHRTDKRRYSAFIGRVMLAVVVYFFTGGSDAGITAAVQGSDQAKVLLSLRGRVVSGSTGDGIGSATVVVVGTRTSFRRELKADLTGNFAIDGLSVGEYRVLASHPDFARGSYGQMWPSGPMRPLRLLSRDVGSITIRLSSHVSGAIVRGTVKTSNGAPVTGATVQAISQTTGRLPSVVTGVTTSDGTYEIAGIAPGKYVIGVVSSYQTVCEEGAFSRCALRARERTLPPVTSQSGQIQTFQSTFYSGANNVRDAEVLQLRPEQTRHFVDLTISLASGVTVEGTVSSPNGPMPAVQVRAVRIGNTVDPLVSAGDAIVTSDSKGRFKFLGVPPGNYLIKAEYRPRSAPTPTISSSPIGQVRGGSVGSITPSDANPVFEGALELGIGTSDISGYQLPVLPAPSLRGVLRFDSMAAKPTGVELAAISLTVRPRDRGTPLTRVRVDSNGSFYFPSLNQNTYVLAVDGLPAWSVTSIELLGRQTRGNTLLLDQSASNAVVTMTHLGEKLFGNVVDATGRREPNATVFLFRNQASAFEPITFLIPSESGDFTFGPIAKGQYSVVAIADGWLDFAWREPDAIAQLIRAATTVRIGDGPTTTTLRALRLQ